MILDKFFRKKVTAKALAEDMFQLLVLDDIDDFYNKYLPAWRTQNNFNESAYRYTLFTYLAAVVSTALVHQVGKDNSFYKVIYYFRQHVQRLAQQYWDIASDEVDKAIEECSDKLARLILTDPKTEPALPFDWTTSWLQLLGVKEHDPIAIYLISYKWKASYVEIAKMFNTIKIES